MNTIVRTRAKDGEIIHVWFGSKFGHALNRFISNKKKSFISMEKTLDDAHEVKGGIVYEYHKGWEFKRI